MLQWVKRMLEVRKQHPVFGQGTFQVLGAENPSVFAFTRDLVDPETGERDTVLCVYNLSRFAQPCELHLAQFQGWTPHELLGRVPFPRPRRSSCSICAPRAPERSPATALSVLRSRTRVGAWRLDPARADGV